MIRLECPECDRRFKVADEKAGRTVRCPECDARVPVPDEDELDEEEERPRKKKRGKKARSDSWFTANHIRGLVGTGLGGLMLLGCAVATFAGTSAAEPATTSYLMGRVVGCCFAAILFLAGLYYLFFQE